MIVAVLTLPIALLTPFAIPFLVALTNPELVGVLSIGAGFMLSIAVRRIK